jgi:hypothetical protein
METEPTDPIDGGGRLRSVAPKPEIQFEHHQRRQSVGIGSVQGGKAGRQHQLARCQSGSLHEKESRKF